MNIDLFKTPEELANCPVTRYFLETHKSNAMEWVSFLDDDSLKMTKDLFESVETRSKESKTILEDGEDSEADDSAYLIVYMLAKENNTTINMLKKDPPLNIDEAVRTMMVYLNCESMRRNGLVKIEKGNGKLIGSDAKFWLTEEGKKFQKNLKGK